MASISGLAVAEIAAGLVLAWSGIENQPVGSSLRDLISGKKLQPTPDAAPITAGTSASSSGGPVSAGGYANPLRSVSNLVSERIDQGVDYSGSGPIFAIGPGIITSVHNIGWPNATFICERLTGGAYAGKYVYFAEDIHAAVHVGQQVDTTTVLGTMFDGGSGIECGWAAPPGLGLSMANAHLQFSGANSTAYGASFSDLLQSLGAPPGIIQSGGIRGTVSPGFPVPGGHAGFGTGRQING